MIQNVNMLNFLKKIEKEEHISQYLFVYYGTMNNDIIVSSIQMIVEKLKMEKFSPTLITKTKLIAIESLQNIVHHQAVCEKIYPYFIVGSDEKNIRIIAGNVIGKTDKDFVVKKLDELIQMEQQHLEKDYKFALKQNKINNAGNAGLGLLDIVCRSNRQVSYKVKKLEKDLFLFNLNVIIS